MKMRLGSQGLLVSEMGLGCMGMDHGYGKPVDRQAMTTLIHKPLNWAAIYLIPHRFTVLKMKNY